MRDEIRAAARSAVLMVAVLAAACSSTPTATVDAIEIVEGDITAYWTPTDETIGFPLDMNSLRKRSGDFREIAHTVTVRYLIGSDGIVRDAEVLKAVPAKGDASWALRAVSNYRFEPAEGNPSRTPVRPTHTVTLNVAPPASGGAGSD